MFLKVHSLVNIFKNTHKLYTRQRILKLQIIKKKFINSYYKIDTNLLVMDCSMSIE